MGALPKNKITRAERGKRRRGNTPKLARDTKVAAIQSHKKGFVAEMLRFAGLTDQKPTKSQPEPKAKASSTTSKPVDAAPVRPTTKQSIAPQSNKRRTQHKG
jgi:hypothetical protein